MGYLQVLVPGMCALVQEVDQGKEEDCRFRARFCSLFEQACILIPAPRRVPHLILLVKLWLSVAKQTFYIVQSHRGLACLPHSSFRAGATHTQLVSLWSGRLQRLRGCFGRCVSMPANNDAPVCEG